MDLRCAPTHHPLAVINPAPTASGISHLTGNALIVAPVPEKTPPPALRGAWRLAASILSRCERVVVFGFAFNPYDVAVLEMLSDAGRAVRSVELFDIAPPLKRAQDVWPAAEVVPFLPPAASEAEARSGEGDLTKRLERTGGVGLP